MSSVKLEDIREAKKQLQKAGWCPKSFLSASKKCDRCDSLTGTIYSMGHDVTVLVCFACHQLWHNVYLKELNKKRLEPLVRSEEWQRLFDRFMGVKKPFVFR